MAIITRPWQWAAGQVHLDYRDDQDHDAIWFAQDQPGASVGRISTAQSIANTTFADITHDTEFFDNAGMWGAPADLARVTIAYDGYYWAATGAKWGSSGAGSRVAAITVNATIVEELSSELPAVAGNYRHLGAGAISLATADIVRTNVWQNSGGALNCSARLHVVRCSGPGS